MQSRGAAAGLFSGRYSSALGNKLNLPFHFRKPRGFCFCFVWIFFLCVKLPFYLESV